MATIQPATVSNNASVDADRIDELESYIDQFEIGSGPQGTIDVTIYGRDSGECEITIAGYSMFEVVESPPEEDIPEFVDLDTEEFLEGLAEYLEEKLVIQAVGNTKLRFPVYARQYEVFPDGTVEESSFDW